MIFSKNITVYILAALFIISCIDITDDSCISYCDMKYSELNYLFINDSNEEISIKVIRNINITPDMNDDQASMIDFDLVNPEAMYGYSIFDATLNENVQDHADISRSYILKFDCLEPSKNTLAFEVTFENGETKKYAGWPESHQSVEGVESYGFAYLSETCVNDASLDFQDAVQSDLLFKGDNPVDQLNLYISVNDEHEVLFYVPSFIKNY